MGLTNFFSRSSYDYDGRRRSSRCEPVYDDVDIIPELPNPNPVNYRIIRSNLSDKGHLVVEILYPDCTNYEGRKILLYLNCTLEKLQAQGSIDPHFSDNPNFRSPFARFVPTSFGWDTAVKLSNSNI